MPNKQTNSSEPNRDARYRMGGHVPAESAVPGNGSVPQSKTPRLSRAWFFHKTEKGWVGRYVLMDKDGELLAVTFAQGSCVVAFDSPLDAADYLDTLVRETGAVDKARFRPVRMTSAAASTTGGDFAYVLTRPIVTCPNCGALTDMMRPDTKLFVCLRCGAGIKVDGDVV